MRRIDTFKLYATSSNGIFIPRKGYNVALLIEQCDNGLPYLTRLPIRHYSYKVQILPVFKVYGRTVKSLIRQTRKEIGSNKFKVLLFPQKSNDSFIIDITRYINSLIHRASLTIYIKKAFDLIQKIFSPKNNNENVIIYVIDKSLITSRLSIRQTYIYWLLFAIEKRDFESLDMIDKVFLLVKDDKTSVRLIYDKRAGTKNLGSRIRAFIMRALPTKFETREQDKQETIDTTTLAKKVVTTLQPRVKKTEKLARVIKRVKLALDAEPELKQKAQTVFNKEPDVLITPKTMKKPENKIKLIKHDIQARDTAAQIVAKSLSHNLDPHAKMDYNKAKQNAELTKLLDTIVYENGLDVVGSGVKTHDPNFIYENMPNNLPYFIAHRMYANEMTYIAETAERVIRPMLEEINHKLISISYSIKPRDPKELEPTYLIELRIKVKPPQGKSHILKLNIPYNINGTSVILNGRAWYFPNILVNIPIFVIKPGKVQFRSNYAAITAYYGLYNKIRSLRFYIGGFKIPAILVFAYIKNLTDVLLDFKIPFKYSEEPEKDSLNFKLNENTYLVVDQNLTFEQKILLNELQRILKKCQIKDPDSQSSIQQTITCFTSSAKANYILSRIVRYMVDAQTYDVLAARGLPTKLYDILKYMYTLAVNEVMMDKHDLQNMYVKIADIYITGIMKAISEGIANYRVRKIYNPMTTLNVRENFVISYLREMGVLRMLDQQNPVADTKSYTQARIVGPGGLPSTESVQREDRNLHVTQFGHIDPVDTQESDPGVSLTFSTGVKYNPVTRSFVPIQPNKDYSYIFGPSASLVPFATKNDPARLLMAANQQRQAVPLISSEHPIVQSGYEGVFLGSLTYVFSPTAPEDSEVEYVDENIILLKSTKNGKTHHFAVKLFRPDIQTGSGVYLALEHEPIVKKGDKVRAGEPLVKNWFLDGQIKLGVNATVAYMSYKGYTYEDGIVISESFAKKLTSVHQDKIELYVDKNDKFIKFPDIDEVVEPGETIVSLNREIVSGSGLYQTYTILAPTRVKVKHIYIYPKWPGHLSEYMNRIKQHFEKTNKALKDKFNDIYFKMDIFKRYTGKWTVRGQPLDYTFVRIYMLRYLPASIGDKLTNRHAAKGVITYIMPDKEVPRLPDGTPVDIIISPLSVISRMNVGQLFETHVGGIMEETRKRVLELHGNRAKITDLLSKVYSTLDVMPNKKYSKSVMQTINKMSDDEFNDFINNLKTSHLYIIMPPVNRLTVEQLKEAANIVGYKFAYKLYLPEYNTYTKEPVTVGKIYVEKLAHIAAFKEHARNIGRYITTTLQPTKGKAKGGGQRFGEYDTYCLLAYDANDLLKELFVVNSDIPEIKHQVINEIIEKGSARVPKTTVPSGSLKMLDAYLLGMGIQPFEGGV